MATAVDDDDVSIDAASEDAPGLRKLGFELNLTNILPENIDLSTVDLRYLSDVDSVDWEFLDGVDTYTFDPDFTEVDVSMTKDGVILIIGVLPTADVIATGVEWSQLEGGQIELNWTGNQGLDQPLRWRLERLQNRGHCGHHGVPGHHRRRQRKHLGRTDA